MYDEKEINEHIESSLKRLNKVSTHEQAERAKIKEQLMQFHAAVDEVSDNIRKSRQQQHKEEMDELNRQAEKLKAAILNNIKKA